MTDNEIIKALECCSNSNSDEDYCKDCPYNSIKYCASAISKDALDLINQQKAEIERLKTEKDNLIRTYAECQAEAVKEFVGEFKRSLINMPQKDINYSNLVEHIDNLYKKTGGD